MTRPTWPELKARELALHPEVFAAYEAFKRAVKAGQRISPDRPFIPVENPTAIPILASEDEEHEYWGTHEMGDAFFENAALDEHERTIIERARQRRAQRARATL
jgi:hypothetical protein